MGMMNPTSTTISLEGKEWWILKSLPVSNKMILDSKLVFNLLLDLPFFVIIQILLAVGNKGDLIEIFWSVILMGAVVTFSCIFSLTMNLKVPKMEWDNEVVVIKQSASAGLSMLGMLLCMFFGMMVMVTPSTWLAPVRIFNCVVLAGAAAFLYRYNVRQDLRKI
jgi:ABC-2 type transport system permease protein